MRCRFSHLNQSRIFGLDGVRPSQFVPTRAAASLAVEANASMVLLVSTGVWWMCSRMRL